jgi:hypothetical protein
MKHARGRMEHETQASQTRYVHNLWKASSSLLIGGLRFAANETRTSNRMQKRMKHEAFGRNDCKT